MSETAIGPKKCPICGRPTIYAYNVTEEQEGNKGTGLWYKCSCGIAFQGSLPNAAGYDKAYITERTGSKEFKDKAIHAQRTYINLIEELVYGRKWLDVGYCYGEALEWLRQRGWICWGIDVNPFSEKEIVGDFETFNFRETPKFDVIWMGHVFEHFKEPLKALRKAYELLPEDGVVVITTPDVDFLHQVSPVRFPHWKHNEHNILWNKESIKREAERLGFQVVMCRSNFSERFMSWWDLHIVLQKIYV